MYISRVCINTVVVSNKIRNILRGVRGDLSFGMNDCKRGSAREGKQRIQRSMNSEPDLQSQARRF